MLLQNSGIPSTENLTFARSLRITRLYQLCKKEEGKKIQNSLWNEDTYNNIPYVCIKFYTRDFSR